MSKLLTVPNLGTRPVYVDILILANLAQRPQHGYELKRSVEQALGTAFSLNNGMLYPALRRFGEMGAIEREVERQQGKPDRHIYHLTAFGGELLHGLLCEFPPEVARSDTEFLVRVAFFDALEPPERVAILAARRAFTQHALDHHERIRAQVSAERLPFPTYAQRVLEYQEQLRRAELTWIEGLLRDNTPGEK